MKKHLVLAVALAIAVFLALAIGANAKTPSEPHQRLAGNTNSSESSPTTLPPVTGVHSVWNEASHTITTYWDPYPVTMVGEEVVDIWVRHVGYIVPYNGYATSQGGIIATRSSIKLGVSGGLLYKTSVRSYYWVLLPSQGVTFTWSPDVTVTVLCPVGTATYASAPRQVRYRYSHRISGWVYSGRLPHYDTIGNYPASGRSIRITPLRWNGRYWVRVRTARTRYATLRVPWPPDDRSRFTASIRPPLRGRWRYKIEFLGTATHRRSRCYTRSVLVR